MATDASGNKRSGSDTRYKPFGGTTGGSSMPMDRLYTGQREIASLDLYDYNARYYDPYIGRFIQADTIIPNPGNSQDFNRYSYVRNNPLGSVDPSGHFPWDLVDPVFWAMSGADFVANPTLGNFGALALDTISLLPALPSLGYFTRGSKLLGNSDELLEFAYKHGDEAYKFVTGLVDGALSHADEIAKAASLADDASDITHVADEGGDLLYRTMKEGENGLPLIGESATTLGVRTPPNRYPDIIPIDGMVQPGTGGMSTSLTPAGLADHRRPTQINNGKCTLPLWEIHMSDLGSLLNPVQDGITHVSVQPASSMLPSTYIEAIWNTRPFWKKVPLP